MDGLEKRTAGVPLSEAEHQQRVDAAQQRWSKRRKGRVLREDSITRAQVRANPQTLYVFGDNMQRTGLGGQAGAMRGEPNALGVPTKHAPTRARDAYFSNRDFNRPEVRDALTGAFRQMRDALAQGRDVVIPTGGLGTGLAELPGRAPAIHAWIEHQINQLGRRPSRSQAQIRQLAARRLRDAHALGERIVYRGAPVADHKPRTRRYDAVYVARSKGLARQYAHGKNSEPGWITAYALAPRTRLLDVRRHEGDPQPTGDVARYRRRHYLGLMNIVERGNWAAARRGVREGEAESHDEREIASDEPDFMLRSAHTDPYPTDVRFLRRKGYTGSLNDQSMALVDTSVLRPLYTRHQVPNGRVLLAKRTAGKPLSEAEHQERVDAARARWAGASLAAGGLGAAAAGYAAARKIRQQRAVDQAHVDARKVIRTAAQTRNDARTARHAAKEAAVLDGLRPTGGTKWLRQSVKTLGRIAGHGDAEGRRLHAKLMAEHGEMVDVPDHDSLTGFRQERLLHEPDIAEALDRYRTEPELAAAHEARNVARGQARVARERIADILENGRRSERVDRAAPAPHPVAGYTQERKGAAVPVWEPDAEAKLAHLKQALGLPPPVAAAARQTQPAPTANQPAIEQTTSEPSPAEPGTILEGLQQSPNQASAATREYEAKIKAYRDRLTPEQVANMVPIGGATDQNIAHVLGLKKPAEPKRARRGQSQAELDARAERIRTDRDRRDAETRAKLSPDQQVRFDQRKAVRDARTARRRTKLDIYRDEVAAVLGHRPDPEALTHDGPYAEPAQIADRLTRINSLDDAERLVRRMPKKRRDAFLASHLLPKIEYERPLTTVQVAPVPMRGSGGTRRVTTPGYPNRFQRRLISDELTENVRARGEAWRGEEVKRAAWRTAQARMAFESAVHRQAQRLAVLGRPGVRRGLIGAAALLGGAAGYGAVRGLRSVFGPADLGKAFDAAAHPRGEHGQFVRVGSLRTDFARDGEPPRVTMLVGMPGSGKSTWRALRMAQHAVRPTTVISTDDQVEDIARSRGLTFSQAFKLLDHKQVDRAHRVALRVATQAGHDVIIDRVNASAKGRAKWLRRVPRHYETHAVVFDVPEDELHRRRGNRAGKVIPKRALGEMRDAYAEPTKAEFDYVHRVRPSVDSTDTLKKAAPNHPQDAADAAERSLSIRLARMFGAWTDGIEEKLLGPDASSLRADMAADLDHAMQPLDAAVEAGTRVPVLVAGGDGGGGPGRTLAFSFLARSPTVTDFIEKYRRDKIAELADEQREVIKAQLLDAARKGASPQEMARRIKEVIGLTASQAQHVQNYRAELEELSPYALERKLRDRRFDSPINRAIENGTAIPGEKISQYVDAYHRRYLAYRATTIARTEGVGGASNGQAATAAALLHGQPGMTVEKTWMSTKDERTRDDHRELNGQVVRGLDTPFRCESGDEIRWPHDPLGPARQIINCRCSWVTRLVPDSDDPESRNDPDSEGTTDE